MDKTTQKQTWALGDKVWIEEDAVGAHIAGFFIKTSPSETTFVDADNLSQFEELLVADKTPDPELYDEVKITVERGDVPVWRLKKRGHPMQAPAYKNWALGDKVRIEGFIVPAHISGFNLKTSPSETTFVNATNLSEFKELLIANETPDPALYDTAEITLEVDGIGCEMPANRLKRLMGR